MIERGVLVWKSKNMKSFQQLFLNLVAIWLKRTEELMCFTTSLNLIAKRRREYMQEAGKNLRRPVLQDFIKRCGTKSAWVAPLFILTVMCAILLLCWKTSCFFTLWSYRKHIYIAELDPILTYFWGIHYLVIMLSNFLSQYIAELYPILKHC